MAKVDATRQLRRRGRADGRRRSRSALDAAQAYVEETRRDVRPSVRGPGRHRGAGDDRPRARRAGARSSRPSSIPIGGGGLASGIALALRAVRPGLRHRRRAGGGHAAGRLGLHDRRRDRGEAARRADDGDPRARRSTTWSPSRTSEISEAIVLLLERTKLVVEGAGAVGVAALLAGQRRRQRDRSCALLSGGNIDATLLICR